MTTFADKLAELREKATKGECYVEVGSIHGAEVWQSTTETGSMLVARCGHAEFDRANANLYAFLANHAEAIEKVVRAADAVATDDLRDALNELEAK